MLRAARASGLRAWYICVPLIALAIGCASDEVEMEDCQDNEEFFLHQVWGPVLSRTCIGCHNAQGEARESDLVLLPDTQPGFIQINMGMLENLSRVELDGEPLLLLKPIGQADHGGAVQIERGGEAYNALATMVERFEAPVACGSSSSDSFFTGVRLLNMPETLRRAALTLVGRLPTPAEERLVVEQGETGLREVLAGMLDEESFYNWLRVVYNDRLLTDRYLNGNNGLDLLDDEEFPYLRWHEELQEGVDDPALIELADRYTNRSIAREPLDLITYVVRNNRPFTEILTADYRLVNGYTARVWGISGLQFNDPLDPTEFAEARIEGLPLAGLLTSPMFLNRFPTTPTNRNRHRSRMVYDLFLATDVLKLASRPVDPTQIEDFNPTLYNPACSVCHAVIDPLAGSFQNWDDQGRYRPPEDGWFTDMRPPGFGEAVIPHDNRMSSLQWLARQVTEDPRFSLGAVHTMFRALTGANPLQAPSDLEDLAYDVNLAAFDAQRGYFETVSALFVEQSYSLKGVITELVLSPYFRAIDLDTRGIARASELGHLGLGQLLTPEQLDRKIEAITGYPWRRSAESNDYLLTDYLIFYGGIDSNDVTGRIREPNGVIGSVGLRMANEMACEAVPRDFAEPFEERLLFPFVDPSYEPVDRNGFVVEQAQTAILQNIRYLHFHFLGEQLSLNDPEIETTYALFEATWREGLALMENDEIGTSLPGNCRVTEEFWSAEELPEELQIRNDEHYTIRAWMAVVTYLMADYKFLYE